MALTKTLRTLTDLVYSDKDRGIVYNSVTALDLSAVETLRGVREVKIEASTLKAEINGQIEKLRAQLNHFARAEARCDEIALDVLREQREINGVMSETGMYKVEFGDGTYVSLLVRPSESVEVDAAVVDELPDELCKIARSPRLDLIKGQLKIGWSHPGVRLIVKRFGTNPPASEDVQWKP